MQTSILKKIEEIENENRQLLERQKTDSENHFVLFMSMVLWVKVYQNNKSISCHFREKGYNNIAIYGLSYVGKTLFDELKNTDISVACYVDKNARRLHAEIPVYAPDENFPVVDAVVITAVYYYDEIKNELKKKIHCPILSLQHILLELLGYHIEGELEA